MADEDKSSKTEDPTAKRLAEAHSKGQVPKSQEVKHWAMLSAGTFVLYVLAGGMATDMRIFLTPFLEQAHAVTLDLQTLIIILRRVGGFVAGILFAPIGLFILAGVGSDMVQNKPVLTLDKLKPDLSRLSPAKGIKKFIGKQPLVEFLKSMGKLAIIGGAILFFTLPRLKVLPQVPTMGLVGAVDLLVETILLVMLVVLAITAVLAFLDLLYQKWDFTQSQMMSRQEIKDEGKQAEGDPQVKARIRQVRMERTRQRMMAAVPQADVVIANPTHFAVALKYDGEEMAAPKLVAKGQDLLALKIREIAEEHNVPIVENPPLARGLYQAVELDAEIPPQFYQAVAQVISFVMSQRSRGRAGRGETRRAGA